MKVMMFILCTVITLNFVSNTAATCDYIVPFSAAMNKDNFYATQFHPEKSGTVGEQILMNFLKL
jgi:glutamine amidotransferase